MKKTTQNYSTAKAKAANATFSEELIHALELAKENNGVFLNAKGKGYPKIYDSTSNISPFNALMIALNSDRHDYLTNEITLSAHANSRNEAIQGLEKGMPYTWYMWNSYVSNTDSSKVLSGLRYDALPEVEKAGYTFARRVRSSYPVFNIDQTTMPFVNKERYNAAVKDNGAFDLRGTDVPAKADAKRRMAFNGDLKKIGENMIHVSRSTNNLAYYNPHKDAIFLIPQQNYESYHEYVSAVNRLLITATGHSQRLSREGVDSGTGKKIADASRLHEALVCELSAAVRNLRYSLPASLSSTEHIDEWIGALRQSPDYVEVLERDINMSVEMLEKAVKGEKIGLRSDVALIKIQTQQNEIEKNFSKVTMLKDDGGQWTLYMQPEDGEALAIHPDKEDVSLYFTTVKTKTDDVKEKVKSAMARKYYPLAAADASRCVDLFHKNAPGIDLVGSTSIFKGRTSGDGQSQLLIRATIDGEVQKARYLSPEHWSRMNLQNVSDVKNAFAAVIYSDVIEKKLQERSSQKKENTSPSLSKDEMGFSMEKNYYSLITSIKNELLRDDFVKYLSEGAEPTESLRVFLEGIPSPKESINLSEVFVKNNFSDSETFTPIKGCPDIVMVDSFGFSVFYRKVSEHDIVTAMSDFKGNDLSSPYVYDLKARLENPKIDKEMEQLQPKIKTPIGEELTVLFGGKNGRNTLDAGFLTPTGFVFKQILRYDYCRTLAENLSELEARVLAMPEYQKQEKEEGKKIEEDEILSPDLSVEKKEEPEYYATVAYLQDGESIVELSRLMDEDKYDELLTTAAEYDYGDAINLEEVYKDPCHNRYDSLVDYNDHYAVVYNGSVGGTFEVLRRVTKEEVLATINRYGLPEKPSEEVLKLETATKEESKGDTLSPMTNIHTIMDLQNIIEEFENTTGYKLEIRDNKLFYDGNLYLYGTPITSLPDNLTVGGNLYLRDTHITSLPEGLTVAGGLDLSGTKITKLPDNLTVGGDLNLTDTPITKLPDNLTVGGELYLRGTNVKDTSNIKHTLSEDARRKINEKQNICLTFVEKSQTEAEEQKQEAQRREEIEAKKREETRKALTKNLLHTIVMYKSIPLFVAEINGDRLHLKRSDGTRDIIDVKDVSVDDVKVSAAEVKAFDLKVQAAAKEYKARYDELLSQDRSITPSEQQKVIDKAYERRDKEVASLDALLNDEKVKDLSSEQVDNAALSLGERRSLDKIEMELKSIMRDDPQRDMLRAYAKMKDKYSNTIFLFHNDDKSYTAIQDDAITLSNLLGLETHKENNMMKVSFPEEYFDESIRKIISSKYRVGVCEDPKHILSELSEKDCAYSLTTSSEEESQDMEMDIEQSQGRSPRQR